MSGKYFYNGHDIFDIVNRVGVNTTNTDSTYFIGFPSGNITQFNNEIISIPNYTYTNNSINYTESIQYQANYQDFTNITNTYPYGSYFNIPSWCNKLTLIGIGAGGGGGGGGGGNYNDVGNATSNTGGGGGGGSPGEIAVETINVSSIPSNQILVVISGSAPGGPGGAAQYRNGAYSGASGYIGGATVFRNGNFNSPDLFLASGGGGGGGG